MRLALGAFVTSSGFGGVAVLTAAWIAYRTAADRLSGDRDIAARAMAAKESQDAEADRRERWWAAQRWLWENRTALIAADPVAVSRAIASLRKQADTETQYLTLDVMIVGMFPEALGEEKGD